MQSPVHEYKKCVSYMDQLLNKKDSCLGTLLRSCPTLLKFDDIVLSQPYERQAATKYLTTVHNGQVKLLLSEIQFLTNNLENVNSTAYVIYAGSAPGNKNIHLSKLFPNVKFIFVDPEEHFFMLGAKNQYTSSEIMDKILYLSLSKNKTRFSFRKEIKGPHNVNVYNTDTKKVEKIDRNNPKFSFKIFNYANMIQKFDKYNVYVIEDYFTSELSEDLVKLKSSGIPLFFISDIRTVSREKNPSQTRKDEDYDEGPVNGDILWNSAQMYNWVSILKPDMFMLKFRCPFNYGEDVSKFKSIKDIQEASTRGIDFVENYQNGVYKFIKPIDIFLQAYQGATSTESRLIGKYPFEIQDYDIKDYEDKFFYYNRFPRSFGYNDSIPKQFLDKYHMIDRCLDCGIAYHILSSYLKKKNMGLDDPVKTHNLFSDILKNLSREMLNTRMDLHGLYYQRIEHLSSIDRYNSFMCGVKIGAKFNDITRRSHKNKEILGSYIKNIFDLKDKDRVNMRHACMMHYLFDFDVRGIIDFNKNIERFDTINELLSTAFSATGSENILIHNRNFYKRFDEFHRKHNIKNVIVFRSTKNDPFFNREFYSKYVSYENVYDLILFEKYIRDYEKLGKRIHTSTLIIVCLEEAPPTFFHLRKYFISDFRNNKILFMNRVEHEIFASHNYLIERGNIIHLETYNPYSTDLDTKFSTKDFTFDIERIDRDIGFRIKNVPYLFLNIKNLSRENDYSDYINCVRIYILTQDLSDDEGKNYIKVKLFDNDDIYTIQKFRKNEHKPCNRYIKNYFLFTNNIQQYSSGLVYGKLRINGKHIDSPKMKNMHDVIHYDKINSQPEILYSFLNIPEKTFRNYKEILQIIV